MISKIRKIISQQSDVVKHGSLYLGSRVGTKLLSFLMLPIWTIFLSPEQYGIIGLVVAYAGMSGVLILLGLPSAIVRQYHDYDKVWSGYIKTIFGYVLGVLFVVYVGMWTANVILKDSAPDLIGKYRNIFWVSLLGGVVAQLAIAGIQAERASKQFIIGNFVSYLAGLSLSLIFVVCFDMGASGFLYGMGLGSVTGVSYMVWNRRKTWLFGEGQMQLQFLKNGIKYGALLLPTALSGWAINFFGRIILERYSGLHEVGLFSFAGNLAMVMSFVMISLVQAWAPEYYSIRKTGSADEIKKSANHIDALTIKVSLFILIGIAGFAGPVISVLVPDHYEPALNMITPLCIGYLFFGFTGIETRNFMYLGKNMRVSFVYVVGSVFVVIGSWLLIPVYGGYGASIASMLAMFIMSLIALILNRMHGEKILKTKTYIYALMFGVACFFADRLIGIHGVEAWLMRGLFALVMVGVLYVLLGNVWVTKEKRSK